MNAISLSRRLISCADTGDLEREDDGCGVLYGIVRDSAWKIINEAEKERERHIKKGTWDKTGK